MTRGRSKCLPGTDRAAQGVGSTWFLRVEPSRARESCPSLVVGNDGCLIIVIFAGSKTKLRRSQRDDARAAVLVSIMLVSVANAHLRSSLAHRCRRAHQPRGSRRSQFSAAVLLGPGHVPLMMQTLNVVLPNFQIRPFCSSHTTRPQSLFATLVFRAHDVSFIHVWGLRESFYYICSAHAALSVETACQRLQRPHLFSESGALEEIVVFSRPLHSNAARTVLATRRHTAVSAPTFH